MNIFVSNISEPILEGMNIHEYEIDIFLFIKEIYKFWYKRLNYACVILIIKILIFCIFMII